MIAGFTINLPTRMIETTSREIATRTAEKTGKHMGEAKEIRGKHLVLGQTESAGDLS